MIINKNFTHDQECTMAYPNKHIANKGIKTRTHIYRNTYTKKILSQVQTKVEKHEKTLNQYKINKIEIYTQR